MNNIILNQLNQVTSTRLEFNPNSTTIFIPKTIKILNSSLKKGSVYIIELYNSVTNPSSSSTLASNWNNGVIPQYNKYIVEIIDTMAKMIKVRGVAADNNSSQFIGWLPFDGFEVVAKV